uniref:Uncharacterized protein n=1 Tax=Oryzias latipes TaxID=8090 RepID=A0A3B3IIL3_ORYLA
MSLTSITFTCICSDPDLEGLPPSTAVRTREITDCFSRSKAVFNTRKIVPSKRTRLSQRLRFASKHPSACVVTWILMFFFI